MFTVTYDEYIRIVNELVHNVIEEIANKNKDSGKEFLISDMEDEFYGEIYQAAGEHNWIIYSKYHLSILNYTYHEDEYFEEVGTTLVAKSMREAIEIMAMYAMMGDARKYFNENKMKLWQDFFGGSEE